METYDDAGFERFCAGLVNAGFSPVPGNDRALWSGPIRDSLRRLTEATRMRVQFHPGWPLRYAHVLVPGLRTEHAIDGIVCLWAEDDPAQVAGRDIEAVWARLDEWAQKTADGFDQADQALDAWIAFETRSSTFAELPLGDLVRRGSNGFRTTLRATIQGNTWRMRTDIPDALPEGDAAPRPLQGHFFLRRPVPNPPRSLDEFRDQLTRKQFADLQRGLAARAPTTFGEPSGGTDFAVLAWPRHGDNHDALVIGFDNQGPNLGTYRLRATPNDHAALRRRAGPDGSAVTGKKVLVAGVGSVGGHVAVLLASSGVTDLTLADDDHLSTINITRHVCLDPQVGFTKTSAVDSMIGMKAPWCMTTTRPALEFDPSTLRNQVEAFDVVVDCTGMFSITAALAYVCQDLGVPLISGAIYHQGALIRVQRQTADDTPIGARPTDARYTPLPPDTAAITATGFLELGCTAPINNAPPTAAVTAATEVTRTVIDLLAGHRQRPDETVLILQPVGPPPFDVPGYLHPTVNQHPATADDDIQPSAPEPTNATTDASTGRHEGGPT